MIYITFDQTRRGLSFVGVTPEEQLKSCDAWLERSEDIKFHLGAQHEAFLLRLLRRVREGKLDHTQIQFYDQGTINPITPDGDFRLPVKGGFFNWRAKELFDSDEIDL